MVVVRRSVGFGHRSLRARLQKLPVLLFFLALLAAGLWGFKDYGISWDEPDRLGNGLDALNAVVRLRPQPTPVEQFDWAYGPAFNMLLLLVNGVSHAANGLGFGMPAERDRMAWLIQHLVTFLFFYVAVWFFYRLVSERFRSWKMGLLGAAILVLSPRIFADSFYNPKDLPLMSMTIICFHTLARYLDRPSFSRAAIHGLACALLIDIRITGILAPALTVLLAFVDVVRRRLTRAEHFRVISRLTAFMLFAGFFTVVFWPALWADPVGNFVRAFQIMGRFSAWGDTVLYIGRMVRANELPWHYAPVWIAVTTPLSYSLLFLAGVFALPRNLALSSSARDRADDDGRPPRSPYAARAHAVLNGIWDNRVDFFCLLWFVLPVVGVIELGSVLYDGWRQLFFIYPAFLLLALVGFRFLWDMCAKGGRVTARIGRALLTILLGLDMLATVLFMIRSHPHENVYFNVLAGRNMTVVRKRFDMDYWGLSYRQLLEYIMRTDTSSVVRVGMAQAHGMDNAALLAPDQASRLIYDPSNGTEHYFLSEYRWHPGEYGFSDEYYAIRVNGGKIAVAYRVRANEVDSVSARPEWVAARQKLHAEWGLSR